VIPLLYAGSRDAGSVVGKVQVTLQGCTAGSLYGKAQNESGSVGESHLTLIETTPSGEVLGWTSTSQGTAQIKGDVNNDSDVDLDDAIYLLYHVNFSSTYPVDQPVDFNGDSEEDLDDAIYLLYHVNFSDTYPLH
jgi:hypothetical protein